MDFPNLSGSSGAPNFPGSLNISRSLRALHFQEFLGTLTAKLLPNALYHSPLDARFISIRAAPRQIE